ncbi:hypothetical protein LLY41_14385 [Cytobacillus firmus]|uniref:hypothetical protein n=1 Tax=Cytobacillus firmus TaxID=1399 RepID=UPI00218763C8|nr:hypothetical protein [Cytobacillus firmus]URM31606.1 hypothetical protein LLY41_14385 [Cytobacillus firmus]
MKILDFIFDVIDSVKESGFSQTLNLICLILKFFAYALFGIFVYLDAVIPNDPFISDRLIGMTLFIAGLEVVHNLVGALRINKK